jgi:hypothetical protein
LTKQSHKILFPIAIVAASLAVGSPSFDLNAAESLGDTRKMSSPAGEMVDITILRNECSVRQDVLDDLARDFEQSLTRASQEVSSAILEKIRLADLNTIDAFFSCFTSEIEVTNISKAGRDQGVKRIFRAEIPMARMRGPANPERTKFIEITPHVRLLVYEKVDGSRTVTGSYIVF